MYFVCLFPARFVIETKADKYTKNIHYTFKVGKANKRVEFHNYFVDCGFTHQKTNVSSCS